MIALGAVVSPAVSRWAGVPAAVVEILYGVLVGALGLAGEHSAPFVRFLADLGFALFLFLAGLEVDADELRRDRGLRSLPPLLSAAASYALVGVLAVALGWSPWVALALGATSVPLLLSVVREAGLAATATGRSMLTMAAVGEVLTVALVAVAEVMHAAGSPVDALLGLFRLMGMLGLVLLGIRLLAVLRWWFPDRARLLVGGGDAAESGVRVGFGLAFTMIAAAAVAGVEPLLGAFVGGLMVAFTVDDRHAIEARFAPLAYGFFVPVFFVHVGIRLDLRPGELLAHLPTVAGMVAVMLIVKVLPNLGWLVVGRPLRLVLASGLLLAAPLTLLIAIADLAGRLGVVDEATATSLVLAAMVASLLFPTLARRLL